MFRRRKRNDDAEAPVEGAEASEQDGIEADAETAAEASDVPAQPAVVVRPDGPWDVDDLPEDDELERIDLGGLRVPVPPETEVRVDVNAEGEVVAATLVRGQSSMQVNVFAAPRTTGIWDEVRAEIAEAIVGGGGGAQDVEGTYGPELFAAVPAQGGGATPARFIGVNGPRWFVRALLTGPAAHDKAAAVPLEEALRSVVVVRGTEAMAVRDPLPLRLPREVAEQAAAQQVAASQPAGEGEDVLALPDRGPEITELR